MLNRNLMRYGKDEAAVIFQVHPRNKERVQRICTEQQLRNIILTEPAGYLDSIHFIKNAAAVMTDFGGILQEAHFARTPYAFVLDIPKVPGNTKLVASFRFRKFYLEKGVFFVFFSTPSLVVKSQSL